MRYFNEYEREIIHHLVEERPNVRSGTMSINSLFSKMEKDFEVFIVFPISIGTSIKIYNNPSNANRHSVLTDFKLINKIHLNTITLLALLEYLEKHYLIYIYKDSSLYWHYAQAKHKHVNLDFRNHDLSTSDTRYFGDLITKDIIDKLSYSVTATPELKELVKNNFKSAEQINHEQNLAIQEASLQTAVIVAVGSMILSVVAIVVSIFK